MTSPTDLELQPLRAEHEQTWRRLWRGYCDFYEHTVSDEITAATWRRLLSADDGFRGIVAIRGDEVVGFANLILHPSTWSTAPVCYLEDLFVAPAARGRGVGHALIQHLVELAGAEGWSSLYWVTRADNETARRVYDRFADADGFVRYALSFE